FNSSCIHYQYLFNTISKHRKINSFPTRRSSDLSWRCLLSQKKVSRRVSTRHAGVRAPRACLRSHVGQAVSPATEPNPCTPSPLSDRKSTRLNSSHVAISYAVFCLKKKI